MAEKPCTIDEYKKWLEKNHDIKITDKTRNHYDAVTLKVQQDYEKSAFWKSLGAKLVDYDERYLVKTGYPLLTSRELPILDIKKFDMFLLKTFRKNIIQNQNYPNPPDGGWILPENWFSRINDVVRTTLLVKYLDGVEVMKEHIRLLCETMHIDFQCYLEAREEGYYAAHLYTRMDFEIPQETWDTIRKPIQVEIQITTQLKEVIKKLLHKYFEERRKMAEVPSLKWQWDYKSDEFIANYLGHILHYVEGMIMEVRDRQAGIK